MNTVERRGICPDPQRTSSEALLALKTTVTEGALRCPAKFSQCGCSQAVRKCWVSGEIFLRAYPGVVTSKGRNGNGYFLAPEILSVST